MKVALDTSVLVAALVEDHPDHRRAASWLRAAGRVRIASTHAFAETWAVLTSMPLEPPVSGQVALTALERLAGILRFVPPGPGTYVAAATRCARLGLRSGAIYDALHLVTAEAQKAELLLTFNTRDFTRLAGKGSPRIEAPADSLPAR